MSEFEFIDKRKSCRTYLDQPVPREDLMKLIEAATMAPSPKHQQNWHFVVISNREMIEKITRIVDQKHTYIASLIDDEKDRARYMRLLPYYTNFRNSESLVVVYSKDYEMIEETILRKHGVNEAILEELLYPRSDAQAIGAAIENFMLAAANMGYGTCYMTGPTYAKKELEDLIKFNQDEYHLMAMISIGVPAENSIKQPKRKPLEEVVTFVD